MRWDKFFDDIKAGNTGGVYLFNGPEELVKRSALEKLRAKLLPAGLEALNEDTLDGAHASRIVESAETLPVMCARRLLVVKNWAPLMSGKAADEVNQVERMEAWLNHPPDTCCVVFYLYNEMDMRKSASKLLMSRATLIEFDYLNDDALKNWITTYLKPLGKRINHDAFDELVFLGGRALTKLKGDLDKLAACTDEPVITIDDVRETVSPSIESNVFRMIDALIYKDALKAYSILDYLFDSGSTCVGIIIMITRHLELMHEYKMYSEKKIARADIMRGLGLSPKQCDLYARQTAKLSAHTLFNAYLESSNRDYDVRNGKMRDRAALDKIMLYLIDMK